MAGKGVPEQIGSNAPSKDFCLRPVGLGSERLRKFVLPCIPTASQETEVTIGRTAILAGVYHSFISRQHVVLSVHDGMLHFRSKAQQGCVYLNDTIVDTKSDIILKEGDIISMMGPKKYFNLELTIIDHIEEAPAKKRCLDQSAVHSEKKRISNRNSSGSGNAGTPGNTDDHSAASADLEGLKIATECPICMELMAVVYGVVPCGHNFCFLCISDWLKNKKTCPSCSSVVTSKIPCHALDNIIQSALVRKNETDVTAFEQRFSEGLQASKKKPPTAASSKPPVSKSKIRNFFEVVDLS